MYVGSEDKILYALDATTGAHLWGYTTRSPIESSPAVANGVVYVGVGVNDNNVYALNASTGALLWQSPVGAVSYSSPAVANGVVYVGSGDNVYAFSEKGGLASRSAPAANRAHFVLTSP